MCNKYPNVELTYEIENQDDIKSGEQVIINIQLEREVDKKVNVTFVHAPLYPKEKVEGWWLVVGDVKNNQLITIKRVTLTNKAKVKLDFTAPASGEHTLKLFFMCDSYAGCDQEYELSLSIAPGEDTGDQPEPMET